MNAYKLKRKENRQKFMNKTKEKLDTKPNPTMFMIEMFGILTIVPIVIAFALGIL